MTGRRFLWRWSIRSFRRERRQYLVVLALLTVAVALSTGSVLAAFHLASAPELGFGTAQVRATIFGDATAAASSLEDQGHTFGSVATATVDVPGSSLRVPLRVQEPGNPVTGSLVDLVEGAWPTAAGEIAVTDDAPLGDRSVGATTEIGSATVTVVGVVENPTDLDDEFVLTPTLDGFGVPVERRSTVFLVDAAPADVTFPAGASGIEREDRTLVLSDRTQIAIAVNVVSAVAMFEVALLAGSGFAVMARRRSREYGLLAAAGGSPAQLRHAALATGLTVGIIGSVVGTAIGITVAALSTSRLEATVGHRIDFSVPWWTVVPTVVLALATGAVAAWWPARALSRQPVVDLLAALRPQPAATGGSTRVGLAAMALGAGVLTIGVVRLQGLLMVIGILLALAGLLLLAPALVGQIGRASTRLPLAGRLAGRAIARQQGRSALVIAALTVALGIPVAIAVITAAIDDHRAGRTTNLDDRTAIVWLPGAEERMQVIPADTSADNAAVNQALDELLAAVPQAVVAPIEVAVGPEPQVRQVSFERRGPSLAVSPVFGIRPAPKTCFDVCEENTLGDRDADGNELLVTFHDAWLATPELQDALGLDLDTTTDDQAYTRFDDAKLSTHRDQSPEFESRLATNDELPLFTSIAPTLIRPSMVADNGWSTRTIGWLVVNPVPMPAEAVSSMTDAAGSTLLTETKITPTPRNGVRAVGIAVGIAVSLGIVLSAVALLMGESAGDLALLRAIGAEPRTRRALAAAMGAILAGAGALLAIPTGYLALAVLLANPSGNFGFALPWMALAALVVLTPLLAAATAALTVGSGDEGRGWLGRRRSVRGGPLLAGRATAAVVVVLALVAGACSGEVGGRDASDGSPSAEQAEPFSTNIGCDPAMDASLQAWAERGVGASIAVVGGVGERQCVAAYGPADASLDRPNTVDTVFSIGSITKSVTAAAVYDLIDHDVLTLDDPVGRHVSGLSDEVGVLTVRQLLLHTSGLTGTHGIDHRPQSEAEAVDAIGSLAITFPSGSDYGYTNAGYTLLALVIESVTDEGFRQYLDDHILRDRTGRSIGGFWDGEPSAPGPRAFGHSYDGSISDQRGSFEGPHWAMNGNGGIAMTPLEMAEWTWALFNGRILSPEATELFLSTTTVLGQGGGTVELAGWGLLPARVIGEPVYTTSGGGGSIGHLMNVGWLPETGRVVVIAENAGDYDVPFFSGDIVPAILAGTGIPTPPVIPAADPAVLAALAGGYRVGDDGRLEITERDGGLLMAATGMEAVSTLLPIPTSARALVDRHEEHAASFVAGATTEGERFRALMGEEIGPLQATRVLGSAFEGELGTYVELQFDGETRLLVVGFDLNGGTEFWSTDGWPVLWMTVQPDGAFERSGRSELDPVVRLVATPDGPQIEGPDGTVTITRAE